MEDGRILVVGGSLSGIVPSADVLVYDVASAKITSIDARDGKPFDNVVVGHYVYGIQWSPDGTELLLQRANRGVRRGQVNRGQVNRGRSRNRRKNAGG